MAIQTGGCARVRTINPPPRKGLRNDPENFVFNYRHRRKLTTYLISSFPPSPLPYSLLPVFFLNMISRCTMNRNYHCGRIRVYLTIYTYIGATVLYYVTAVFRRQASDVSRQDINTHRTHNRYSPFTCTHILLRLCSCSSVQARSEYLR